MVEMAGGKGTVTLDGEVTVRCAAEIRNVLMKALDESDEIAVDFSNVTSVDLAGLQLICSAHRSVTLAGKRLSCSGAIPDAMKKTVKEAGYDRLTGCRQDDQKSCFWVQEDFS